MRDHDAATTPRRAAEACGSRRSADDHVGARKTLGILGFPRRARWLYNAIRLPLVNGVPTGDYEDFVTGFMVDYGLVWGPPVGVALVSDGSLLVSDDGSNAIWRVAVHRQIAAR